MGHPYRRPVWMDASGPGDCSRTPLDDEIEDDEEPAVAVEPEFYDDEIEEE